MKLACSLSKAACIFDKDGLLVDTEMIWFEAYQRLLDSIGAQHDNETHRLLMGASADVCINLLQKRHAGLRLTREQLFRTFREVREERGLRPMPGAVRLIEVLGSIGYPLALATSARRKEAEEDLAELGWTKYFGAIVAAEDVLHHKPAPDVYLEAARRLSIDPRACVAYEDGVNGTLSAHAAGMQVVFVRDERFGIKPPLEATLVVNSLTELVSLKAR